MKIQKYLLLKIQITLVLLTLFMWKRMIEVNQIEKYKSDLGFGEIKGINIKES